VNRRTRRIRRARLACAGMLALTVALAAGCGDDTEASDPPAAEPTSPSTAPTISPGATDAGAQGASYPVTIESCGTDYTFEKPPENVLIGWPESIETLMALGVEDTVIGYLSGSLSSLPDGAPDVPEVSPDFAPSREAVAAAGADLLVLNDLTAIAGDSGGVSLDDVRAAGTNVFVLGDYCGFDSPAPTTIDVVLQDIRDLGAIFGVPERAEQLVAETEDRLAAAANGNGLSTAFVQVYDGTLYALSGTSYAAVLDAVGLTNSFADLDGNFSEISAEEVLTLTPDVIIVVYDQASTDADAAITEISELLAASPAVTEGQIIPVTNSAISASGITLIDIVDDVATSLRD
jgi:iron complex transport system substrate-binding protein